MIKYVIKYRLQVHISNMIHKTIGTIKAKVPEIVSVLALYIIKDGN